MFSTLDVVGVVWGGGGEKVQGVAMGERWMIRLIEVMKRHFFFEKY